MTAAAMSTATVISTFVSTVTMLVIVMVALDVGVIAEVIRKKCLDRCIARTADTAVELDARLRKSHLCATADASANENFSAYDRQKSRKCSVSLTFGINYSF